MPPPQYAEHMIICGPDYETRRNGFGDVVSVSAPLRQPYDIASLLNSLPQVQQPELLIARVDGSLDNFPGNLSQVKIPKLVILGDSHHMQTPLRKLLTYTFNERYDFFVLDHNKQHAHWYIEAGVRALVWIPALLLADDFRPPAAETTCEIRFVGQVGLHHPHRVQLIRQLQQRKLPIEAGSFPQEMAYSRYNSARISMNCSLNGDLNLRVFEVLAAGGMLLTDRLSPLSGLYDLFHEGVDFIEYGNAGEFECKALHYLQNNADRNRIAVSGNRRLTQRFDIKSRSDTLNNLVNGAEIEPVYSVFSDKRIGRYQSQSKAHFFFRVAVYEWLQEQHRRFDDIKVLNSASGDIRICCDLADLPRLELFGIAGNDRRDIELIEKCGLQQTIRSLEHDGNTEWWQEPDKPQRRNHTVMILSAAEFIKTMNKPNAHTDAFVIADWLEQEPSRLVELSDKARSGNLSGIENTAGVFYREVRWS